MEDKSEVRLTADISLSDLSEYELIEDFELPVSATIRARTREEDLQRASTGSKPFEALDIWDIPYVSGIRFLEDSRLEEKRRAMYFPPNINGLAEYESEMHQRVLEVHGHDPSAKALATAGLLVQVALVAMEAGLSEIKTGAQSGYDKLDMSRSKFETALEIGQGIVSASWETMRDYIFLEIKHMNRDKAWAIGSNWAESDSSATPRAELIATSSGEFQQSSEGVNLIVARIIGTGAISLADGSREQTGREAQSSTPEVDQPSELLQANIGRGTLTLLKFQAEETDMLQSLQNLALAA